MLPVYYINDALSNATKVNDIEFDLHAKKTTFLYFVAAGGILFYKYKDRSRISANEKREK